jgi:hypothetical protein
MMIVGIQMTGNNSTDYQFDDYSLIVSNLDTNEEHAENYDTPSEHNFDYIFQTEDFKISMRKT